LFNRNLYGKLKRKAYILMPLSFHCKLFTSRLRELNKVKFNNLPITYLTILLLILLESNALFAIDPPRLTGIVQNEKGESLAEAHIALSPGNIKRATDKQGRFSVILPDTGVYTIHISYLGYRCLLPRPHHIIKDTTIIFPMTLVEVPLPETTISSSNLSNREDRRAIPSIVLNDDQLKSRAGATFVERLTAIPGVKQMAIGQGAAKPVIRGLAFNRVVVADQDIKQEGQQWGADHGLEIDPFEVEQTEIIKGPASLTYGSDAIGGVIRILPAPIPGVNQLKASGQVLYRSVNESFSQSVSITGRKQKWHFRARVSNSEFGDYKIPANKFYYNNWWLPIYNQKLKNTAGKEQSLSLQIGTIGAHSQILFSYSLFHNKTGFFAGAHGIPTVSSMDDDGDSRNIDLPYQQVTHHKLLMRYLKIYEHALLTVNTGLQYNLREEHSSPHSHGLQPLPEGTLELEMKLATIQNTIKYSIHPGSDNEFTIGTDFSYQDNQRGGYYFLLPAFNKTSGALFATFQHHTSNKATISMGIRGDLAGYAIKSYADPYIYLIIDDSAKAEQYAKRSMGVDRLFTDLSWSFGVSKPFSKDWMFRANISRSFRLPSAIELASNGIHHGSFRHELGNKDLPTEKSYQTDFSVEYSKPSLQWSISPFFSYHPDFIFLNPSGEWSYLPDAGQIWNYTAEEAIRSGLEWQLKWTIKERVTLDFTGDYVYSYSLTSHYPIPLTPPLASSLTAQTDILNHYWLSKPISFSATLNATSAQNKVARNELKTPGYLTVDARISTEIKIGSANKSSLNVYLSITNLLNNKYYNHLSYYRFLELPEPARNFQIGIEIKYH